MMSSEDWQITDDHRNPWESMGILTKILHSQVRWSRWPSPAWPPRWSPRPSPWPTASTASTTASSRRRGAADGWRRWQSSAHGCGASKAPTKGRTGCRSLWGFHTAIAMENHKKFRIGIWWIRFTSPSHGGNHGYYQRVSHCTKYISRAPVYCKASKKGDLHSQKSGDVRIFMWALAWFKQWSLYWMDV